MTDFSPHATDTMAVHACLISLASNYQPEHYLLQALTRFEKNFALETIAISDPVISLDKQAVKNSGIYHNQMALAYFNRPIFFAKLVEMTKQLEISLDRKKFHKPIVTLDMDIVAVALHEPQPKQAIFGISVTHYQDSLLTWCKINRRFPLADYEILGLENLVNQHTISPQFLTALLK